MKPSREHLPDLSKSMIGRRSYLQKLSKYGALSVIPSYITLEESEGEVDAISGGSPMKGLEPVGSVNMPGLREAVVDNSQEKAYVALTDGFGIVDVSNPDSPESIYEERDLTHQGSNPMGSIKDVKVNGDRLLVPGPAGFNEGLSGFFLYDISNPHDPQRVAFQPTTFSIHNSFITSSHVYLTGSRIQNEPVVIYNIQNDEPKEVARWSVVDNNSAWEEVESIYRTCHDVFVQNEILYIAYWDAGTWL